MPNLARCIDDICVLRSLHTDNPNHGPALFMMNNGSITPTRPSMGAWLSYGLGTENADLPGFVVLCPGRPVRFAEPNRRLKEEMADLKGWYATLGKAFSPLP